MPPEVQHINTREEWVAFARKLGPGSYWHEPDECEVSGVVEGNHIDNAMGTSGYAGEYIIKLCKDGEAVGVVNLANVLGWAAEST